MIKNGPAERRRFIDMEECQINKMYLYDLIGYNKILGQRNKVLKEIEFRPDYEQLLDVMDIQLSDFGKKIIEERKRFISHLNDVIKDIHHQISGEKEELVIEYEPSTESDSYRYQILRFTGAAKDSGSFIKACGNKDNGGDDREKTSASFG